MLPAHRREKERQDCEGQAILNRELSECAVIRLSPERIQREDEDQDGGVALLRSRVEQQSTLIAMLKQRGDETLRELETYKKSFEETLAEKRGLEAKLREEERLKALVEKRFNTLAENHEEMIKIKDEYKHSNQALMAENEKLKQENQMKFSAAVEERESRLSKLREELGAKYQRERELEECCTRLEARVAETEGQLCSLKEKSGKEAERLEERLSAALQTGQELRHSLDTRKEEVIRLKREKQQLEERCRQWENDTKSKESRLSEIQSRLSQAEKRAQKLKDDFRGRAEEVSRDSQVTRLRKELEEARGKTERVEREFSAYKKHSSELLRQERELNSKLRHLLE